MEFLDATGLARVWTRAKDMFVPKSDDIAKPPLYADTSVSSGSTSATVFTGDPHELTPDGTAYTIDDFIAFIEIPAEAERTAYYAAGGSISDQFIPGGDYAVIVTFAKATTAAINFKTTVFYRKPV
jgi:hypothetical protein